MNGRWRCRCSQALIKSQWEFTHFCCCCCFGFLGFVLPPSLEFSVLGLFFVVWYLCVCVCTRMRTYILTACFLFALFLTFVIIFQNCRHEYYTYIISTQHVPDPSSSRPHALSASRPFLYYCHTHRSHTCVYVHPAGSVHLVLPTFRGDHLDYNPNWVSGAHSWTRILPWDRVSCNPGFQLAIQPRIAWVFCSSCLYHQSATRSAGLHRPPLFMPWWGWNPGLCVH